MAYYVYKITNIKNGKWYIGKRKHSTPYKDTYMGSGKLIKRAIDKYGKEHFVKEILAIFDTNQEAALLEASLVTKDTMRSNSSYNMHEGGHGGFGHLNTGDEAHIERARKAGKLSYQKNLAGRVLPGTFKKGDARTKELSRLANIKKKELVAKNPDIYRESYKKISEFQKQNNSMHGRIWIEKDGERKAILADEYIVFKPAGWISASEKNKLKCSKMKKRWINKNDKNMLINSSEYSKYIEEGWKPGRVSSKK